MEEEVAAALSTVLGGATVADVRRVSGGASRETFVFTADGRALVLQRQRSAERAPLSRVNEVSEMARLAGVPVPEVIASSEDGGPLGASYTVLAFIGGETIARKILRDEAFAIARTRLTADCAHALARLHSIDPAGVPLPPAADPVATLFQTYDAHGHLHATFEMVFRWLDEHRPEPYRIGVVHGDFRLGNLIVGHEGLNAVIDWELVHIGDVLEDLGWLCAKPWRHGGRRPVAGVGEYDELLRVYGEAAGAPVDPTALRWWEIFGTLRWGVLCIMQTEAHLSGAYRSHELAAIGRRVCETEHDLFLAMDGLW
jgi:aminoglycoside phosphotransferase (APT) family kinase protein